MRWGFAALALLPMAGGLWPELAEAQSLCEGTDYQRALCAYRAGDVGQAAALFARIAEQGEPAPETIKARYFLARTQMKQHRWQEAADQFVRIYGLSRGFYDEWSCDFLLGECRKALGLQ